MASLTGSIKQFWIAYIDIPRSFFRCLSSSSSEGPTDLNPLWVNSLPISRICSACFIRLGELSVHSPFLRAAFSRRFSSPCRTLLSSASRSSRCSARYACTPMPTSGIGIVISKMGPSLSGFGFLIARLAALARSAISLKKSFMCSPRQHNLGRGKTIFKLGRHHRQNCTLPVPEQPPGLGHIHNPDNEICAGGVKILRSSAYA